MKSCRVTIEMSEGEGQGPVMRWERSGSCDESGAFVLLGRAFEVAQRETGGSFAEAVAGFCKGALIAREDLAEALRLMESRGGNAGR